MKTDDVKSSCEFNCEIFALLPPFGPLCFYTKDRELSLPGTTSWYCHLKSIVESFHAKASHLAIVMRGNICFLP